MSTALAKAWYLLCRSDISDEEAQAMFKRKFGYPPDEIQRAPGGVWAGPIEESRKPSVRPGPTPDLISL